MPLYRVVTVSRHFACRQHEMRMALKTPPRCVPGFFPVVDDEYHESVDVLLSVVENAEYAAARPYVMVDMPQVLTHRVENAEYAAARPYVMVDMPQVLTHRREPIALLAKRGHLQAPTTPKAGSGSDHPGGRSPQPESLLTLIAKVGFVTKPASCSAKARSRLW
jgi:hypothetical protein